MLLRVSKLGSSVSHILVLAGIGVLAFILRAAPYFKSGVLSSEREYDDGVMLAGSLSLISGRIPYRDFVFLHPPASLLALSPAALFGRYSTEGAGMAAARIVVIIFGIANCVLIAYLLRRHGVLAMIAGGGVYAVWSPAVASERTVLLEPAINLCLLVALVGVASGKLNALLWTGASLGIACATKYWVIVDVVLLGLLIGLRWRAKGLRRFLLGGVLAAGLMALPFFMIAPAEMWRMTVGVQFERPSALLSLADKAHYFSPFTGFQGIDKEFPDSLLAIVVLMIVLMGLVPLVQALHSRIPAAAYKDEVWWGVVAAVHVAVLAASPVFYYHYAAWATAPLALVVGAAVGRFVRPGWRVKATLISIAIPLLVMTISGLRHLESSVLEGPALTAWGSRHNCTWAFPQQLVSTNSVSSNLRNGCSFDIDPFGVGLTLSDSAVISDDSELTIGNARWRERAWKQIGGSDGLILPRDMSKWWFDETQRRVITSDFAVSIATDQVGYWERVKG